MKNDVPFFTYLISYEVKVSATVYILTLYCNTQAFIEAPLSTAVFPQRFSFFTVCLVQWLRWLALWWRPKGSLFKFKSVDCYKMHFFMGFFIFLYFRVLLRVVNKSLLERHLQPSFMHVVYVASPDGMGVWKIKKTRWKYDAWTGLLKRWGGVGWADTFPI